MAQGMERRRFERIAISKAIYLEILPRGIGNRAPSSIVKCETVDVSIKGLRLLVPEAVKIGSSLQVAVPAEDWIENLELSGKARWLQKADTGPGYWLGLELQDTNLENMEKWYKTVQSLQQRNT